MGSRELKRRLDEIEKELEDCSFKGDDEKASYLEGQFEILKEWIKSLEEGVK